MQCRVTTEDPENKFMPDYGRILTYRSAGGFGVRLDGGMGYAGAVITPFYDSLLVKLTASGRDFDLALQRMDRALREFRIRGVKTNIPFLENVIPNPDFRSGQATTTLIDTTPELFDFKPRRDRATKLLTFLGDVIVNGNPQAKGYSPPGRPAAGHRRRPTTASKPRRPARASCSCELGPRKFAEWTLTQKRLLITDTTFRDAHQSLLATRVRTYDMLAVADAVARRTPQLFTLEMWGGATFDTAMRFLHEDPWDRLRLLRENIPNICFQMLFRGSNAVGYSNYPDNVVAGFVKHAAASGIDIFRIFDSLNYLPNLQVAMEAVQETHAICEAAICYTGDILDPERAPSIRSNITSSWPGNWKRWARISSPSRTWPACAGPTPPTRWSRRSRRKSACPFIFTRTTPAASTAASVLKPAKPAWTSRTSPSPPCPAPPASPISIPSSPRCTTPPRHRPGPRRAQRILRLLGTGPRRLRALRHRAAQPAAPKFI